MPHHDRRKQIPEVEVLLRAVVRKLTEQNSRLTELHTHLIQTEKRIMAAIDDLKAAQEELSTEVTRIAGEIDQLLAVIVAPGTPDAQVAEATARARGLTAALRAASDKSDAAVPG